MSSNSSKGNIIYQIVVKQSGSNLARFELDPLLVSLSELKCLIEDVTDIPAEEQRLVYHGRVLKDDSETLHTYLTGKECPGDKPLMPIFMTRTKAVESLRPASTPPVGVTPDRSPAFSSKSNAFGSIANLIGKNPEVFEKMLMANPQMKAFAEKNPHVKHALKDPGTLKSIFEMSTNPTAYKEMMRGHDRAMSNLENMPQGFQHLVRLHKSMGDLERRPEKQVRTKVTESQTKNELTKEPMPNPWENRRAPAANEDRLEFAADQLMKMRLVMNAPEPQMSRKAMLKAAMEYTDPETESDDDDNEMDEKLEKQYALFSAMAAVQQDEPTNSSTAALQSSQSSDPFAPGDLSQYEARFHRQLKMMEEMGFNNKSENIRALLSSGGNVHSAIEWLINRDLSK